MAAYGQVCRLPSSYAPAQLFVRQDFKRLENPPAMLNIAIWLVVGAVIGWVAGLLMRHEEDPAVFLNVLVGVIGALVAGWFIAPRLGLRPDPRVFNLLAVAVALMGAVAALGVLGLVRRRRAS
jgi:uncharacterized membrane protein YeaQ/YmgE (transglycosylase-associated protein family)